MLDGGKRKEAMAVPCVHANKLGNGHKIECTYCYCKKKKFFNNQNLSGSVLFTSTLF